MTPVRVQQSRVVGAPVEDAFDTVLTVSLPEIFPRRSGLMPPITEVRDQSGDWQSAGQTRTVVTGDGGTVHEELTAVERPSHFGYRITEITGPMKPLVRAIDGRWSFAAEDGGTRITWQWSLEPRSAVTRPVVLLVGRFWNGWARGGLEELGRRLGG